MRAIIIGFFLLCAGHLFGNTSEIFAQREKQLAVLLSDLRKVFQDQQREAANAKFKSYLLETIKMEGAFDYPFTALKTIGTIKSPDNSFRFFNWNVEQEDESQKYYCFILKFDEKKKNYKVIELTDNSIMLPQQPDEVLDENMWYGALYYSIIPVIKSGKTVYTLLGYDANNGMSHTKLIDVLSFNGAHVKLGSPLFKIKDQVYKRVFFEHSKKCVMSLSYDDSRKKIIFDHLSPESPTMEGFREFYVPDMSYDAFKYEGGRWLLEEDIISVNPKPIEASKTITTFDLNNKGEMVEKQQKNKWIDPSNATAPAGQNIHKAALPEDQLTPEKKEKKKKVQEEFPGSKKNTPKSAIGAPVKKKKRK